MRTAWLQAGVILVHGSRRTGGDDHCELHCLAIDGNCTLREAILAANSDTAVDACAASDRTW